MSPKPKSTNGSGLKSVISPNAEFGIEILSRSAIPSPTGRGRLPLVPQLTIARTLHEALEAISKNGIGIAEEACGFNLEAPATRKEAEKLGLKKLTSSFASYVRKQLEEFKLTDKVEIVRREGGKKLYLTGPAADHA